MLNLQMADLMLSLHLQYPIDFMLYEGTFFDLKDTTPRFKALQRVPRVLRDVHTISAFLLAKHDALHHLPLIIIRQHPHLTFQQDKGLILGHMMMDRHDSPRLQRIQKAMALILKALVKVIVHPQPR